MTLESDSPETVANISLKPATSKGSKRVLQLDTLRGVAILLVLGHHYDTIIKPDVSGYCAPLAHFFVMAGWTGVDLFFVLSGYLIGGLLFREIKRSGELHAGRFIVRRGFKIWPLYYLYLAYCIFYPVVHSHTRLSVMIRQTLPNLLHIQNYVYMKHEHTWSLSVEEHFYLMLPLLLFYLVKSKRLNLIPYISAFLVCCCTALRALALHNHTFTSADDLAWQWHIFTPTHLRIDGLFFGVMLAYFYHLKPEVFRKLSDSASTRWIATLAGLVLISPSIFILRTDPDKMFWMIVPGFAMIYIGYGAILLSAIYNRKPDGSPGLLFASLPSRALAYIGFYSYAIYLWHIDLARDRVLHWVDTGKFNRFDPGTRWLLAFISFCIVATVVGIVMNRIVEAPVLAFRDKFFPEKLAVKG